MGERVDGGSWMVDGGWQIVDDKTNRELLFSGLETRQVCNLVIFTIHYPPSTIHDPPSTIHLPVTSQASPSKYNEFQGNFAKRIGVLEWVSGFIARMGIS
jgi:hypothetical protein